MRNGRRVSDKRQLEATSPAAPQRHPSRSPTKGGGQSRAPGTKIHAVLVQEYACNSRHGWQVGLLSDVDITPSTGRQHCDNRNHTVLLNPFCQFRTPGVLALKATVFLPLTCSSKSRSRKWPVRPWGSSSCCSSHWYSSPSAAAWRWLEHEVDRSLLRGIAEAGVLRVENPEGVSTSS